MNTEFEAKFYPVEKDEVRACLKAAGAELAKPERLMRIVLFQNIDNPGMKVHYLRVRDEGDKITFSAKVHAREGEELSAQKEAQTTVADLDSTVAILEGAGLITKAEQEKYRETWHLDECEVEIDSWPDIEPYIEIEGPSEAAVKSVAEKLGFDWGNKIVTSVTEIYAEKFGLSFDEALRAIQVWKFKE